MDALCVRACVKNKRAIKKGVCKHNRFRVVVAGVNSVTRTSQLHSDLRSIGARCVRKLPGRRGKQSRMFCTHSNGGAGENPATACVLRLRAGAWSKRGKQTRYLLLFARKNCRRLRQRSRQRRDCSQESAACPKSENGGK